MRIKIANYALQDLLYALECSGVTEVACTKEDNDLLIIYDTKKQQLQKYKSKNKRPEVMYKNVE